MAEELGLEVIRAEALLYVGSVKVELGDPTGIDDVRESIAIGDAINSPEVARSYNNLAVLLRVEGRLAESLEASQQGLGVAKRFGLMPYLNWDRGALPGRLFERGHFDEALAAADEALEADQGSVQQWPALVRAQIRVARDDGPGALADSASALEEGRALRYPQAIYPSLVVRAFVLTSLGDIAGGREVLEELLDRRASQPMSLGFGGGAIAAWSWEQHGLLQRFLDTIRSRRTPWLDASEAVNANDWVGAAEIYASLRRRHRRSVRAPSGGRRREPARGARLLPLGQGVTLRAPGRGRARGDRLDGTRDAVPAWSCGACSRSCSGDRAALARRPCVRAAAGRSGGAGPSRAETLSAEAWRHHG